MAGSEIDSQVRLAAFEFLETQTGSQGDVLPRDLLARGFLFHGTRVPLLGPQGIFKPALLPEIPLSITSVAEVPGRERPYEDQLGDDGLLRYRYRGTVQDRDHRDNVGLRRALETMTPLIYFHGMVPGQYAPVWPAYIIGDDRGDLSFTVDLRLAMARMLQLDARAMPEPELQRAYVIRPAKQRLHQGRFREHVLRAYQVQCSVCRLRHRALLEAAHIIPDSHPMGEPAVYNGIAFCKLHHGAFDSNIMGIRPDLRVEIRTDVLREADGPILVHGLQGFQHASIHVPGSETLKPRRDLLEQRYAMFMRAG